MRHGSVGRIRDALPDPWPGLGQRIERVFGLGHTHIRGECDAWPGRGALFLPGGFQLQACRRPAACRTGNVGAPDRRTRPGGPRPSAGRGRPVARSLARKDRPRAGGPAVGLSGAGTGASVLRHPPGSDARHEHHALQGLSEEGRNDRLQLPGIQPPIVLGPEEPDRAGRRDPREARLLCRRRLSAELRLAGRQRADRPRA